MAKSRRGKSGSSTEIAKWESELSDATFTEETWNPRVIFVVPRIENDEEDLKLLQNAVSGGTRKLFSSVSKEHLLREVKDILHSKQAKGKHTAKAPAFSEVCEVVKNTLDAGEQLSTKLLCQLLKFKLLTIKQKDTDRREEEKKAEAALQKQKTQDERSRSKGSDSAGKRSKSHSPGKGKKGKKEETSPKKDTKLKKRGEMEDQIQTIDDEPQGPDAPDHYIILFGFDDVNLITALHKIHITINSIINFDNSSMRKGDDDNNNDLMDGDSFKTKQFWKDYNNVFMLASNSDHPIKNIGKFLLNGEVENKSSINETELGVLMFDKLAKCCYEMLRQEKNFQCYLENLKVIDVADSSHPDKALQPSNISLGPDDNIQTRPTVEMRTYKALMEEIPPESQSIPYQMNCILEQVVESAEMENCEKEIEDQKHKTETNNLVQYFDDVLLQLGCTDNIIENISPTKLNKEPSQVLNAVDKRSTRLFPLQESENYQEVIKKEDQVLLLHKTNKLLKNSQSSLKNTPVISASLRQIQSVACDDDSKFCIAQFNHHLALSSFEYLSNRCCCNDTRSEWLSHHDSPIPYDYPFNVNRMPEKHLDLTKWCYTQYIGKDAVPQIIADLSEDFDFVDTHYHRSLGCTLLIFHNSNLQSCKRELSWNDWIHSDVGYQNYLEFVAPYIKPWTDQLTKQEEEAKRIEESISQERSPTPEIVSLKDSSSNKLLTRAEMAALKTVDEDKGGKKKGKKSGRTRSNSPTKGKSPEKSALKSPNKRTASGKSNSGSRDGSASKKNSRVRIQQKDCKTDSEVDKNDTEIETRQYLFTGYNLGDNLCHLYGNHWSYHTKCNGRIDVIKTLAIQNNSLVDISYHCKGDMISLAIKNPTNEPAACKNVDTGQSDIEASQTEEENEIITNPFPLLDPHLPDQSADMFSVNANLSNGLRLSYSATPSKDELDEIYQSYNATYADYNNIILAPPTSSSAQHIKAGSPKGRKKHEGEAKRLEEIERQLEADKERLYEQAREQIKKLKRIKTSAQDLYVSCPNDLQLKFQNRLYGECDDDEDSMKEFTLKQWYANDQSQESVRVFTMSGDVIKFLPSNEILIVRPDGSLYHQQQIEKNQNEDVGIILNQWKITEPDGSVIMYENNEEDYSNTIHLSTVHSTDTETGIILTTREDGVKISHQLDGTCVVDHLDGTRITTKMISVDGIDSETGESKSQVTKKIIIIDCPGYALVQIDCSIQNMMTTFGDGSEILRHQNGNYEIKSPQDAHIMITKEGHLSYTVSDTQENEDQILTSGSCLINPLTPSECFKMTDKDFSQVSISHDGTHLISNIQQPYESSESDEPFDIKYLLLYSDGSAEELLHSKTVESILKNARNDASIAVIESDVEDNPSAKCFTILQPVKVKEWGTPHRREDITPTGLLDKDLSSFEMRFKSNPNKPNGFGKSLGKGLHIDNQSKCHFQPSKPMQPTRLSVEQFIRHSPLTNERREMIKNCLQKYNSHVERKIKQIEDYAPVEPRTQEEKEAAKRLLDGYCVNQQRNAKGKISDQGITSDEALSSYMNCLHPVKPPPTPKPKPCLTAEQWERRHIDYAEAKYASMEINAGLVPAYFDTEEGQNFLLGQSSQLNIDDLAGKLAKNTIHTPRKENDSSPNRLSSGNVTDSSCDGSLTQFLPPMTSSESAVNDHKITRDISNPSCGRPGNPTPLQATTKAERNGNESRIGDGSPLRVPSDTKEGKVTPLLIESKLPLAPSKEPLIDRLHRPPNTVSVSGSVNPTLTSQLEGFTMMPIKVDFGYLKEGMTYRCTVALKNLGISSSRFKINQPPPSTGMRVIYTPGPIAAGMLVYFDVEIFAIAVGVKGSSGIGSVSHQIEVVTEIETYLLPVHAYVLTQRTDLDGAHFTPGTGIRMVNAHTTIKEFINRPRSREKR